MNGGSGRRKRSARRGSARSRMATRRRKLSPARILRMTAGNGWMPGNRTFQRINGEGKEVNITYNMLCTLTGIIL